MNGRISEYPVGRAFRVVLQGEEVLVFADYVSHIVMQAWPPLLNPEEIPYSELKMLRRKSNMRASDFCVQKLERVSVRPHAALLQPVRVA